MRTVIAGRRLAVEFSERDEVRDLLKRTAVALKQADVPFALCGGYAAWVRGAPEPVHDADFLVAAADADRARKALADAGLDVVEPAEDWLVKVMGEKAFVDVLWRTCGQPVESDLIDRSEVLPVLSVHMPVLATTDIVVTKLMALDEHYCDFAPAPAGRAGAARAGRLGGGAPGGRRQRLRRRLPRSCSTGSASFRGHGSVTSKAAIATTATRTTASGAAVAARRRRDSLVRRHLRRWSCRRRTGASTPSTAAPTSAAAPAVTSRDGDPAAERRRPPSRAGDSDHARARSVARPGGPLGLRLAGGVTGDITSIADEDARRPGRRP